MDIPTPCVRVAGQVHFALWTMKLAVQHFRRGLLHTRAHTSIMFTGLKHGLNMYIHCAVLYINIPTRVLFDASASSSSNWLSFERMSLICCSATDNMAAGSFVVALVWDCELDSVGAAVLYEKNNILIRCLIQSWTQVTKANIVYKTSILTCRDFTVFQLC